MTFQTFGALQTGVEQPSTFGQQNEFNAQNEAFPQQLSANLGGFEGETEIQPSALEETMPVTALEQIDSYVVELHEDLMKILESEHVENIQPITDIRPLEGKLATAHAFEYIESCELDFEALEKSIENRIEKLSGFEANNVSATEIRSLDVIEKRLLLLEEEIDKLLLRARKGIFVNAVDKGADKAQGMQGKQSKTVHVKVAVRPIEKTKSNSNWNVIYE